MSYDISVKFKTEQDREKMKNFLSENVDFLLKMQGNDRYAKYSLGHEGVPYNGEDLGYAPKMKNMLGFHGRRAPKYLWDLCAWMAVKSEYKDSKGNMNLYYDREKMLVTFDTNNKQNTVVTQQGIPVEQSEDFIDGVVAFMVGDKARNKKNKELLIQLNEKWNEYVLKNEQISVKTKKPKF